LPNGWIHATTDLIAYGRPYFDIHQHKDKAHEQLGSNHRKINHEWYQAFGIWTFNDPFPDFLKDMISDIREGCGARVAEERMAYWDHGYSDRIWDDISEEQREYIEGAFAWILLHPDFLKKWAGVDVIKGKIKRLIDQKETWEECPELIDEYHRLCCYVKKVIENHKYLQIMLETY